MKTEYKIEGSKLVLKVSEEQQLDLDHDGSASASASLSLDIEINGFELIDELIKSDSMVKAIKEKLGM